jgi:hypothetical protein
LSGEQAFDHLLHVHFHKKALCQGYAPLNPIIRTI